MLEVLDLQSVKQGGWKPQWQEEGMGSQDGSRASAQDMFVIRNSKLIGTLTSLRMVFFELWMYLSSH